MIDPVNLENIEHLKQAALEVAHYEYKTDLNNYLRELGPEAQVHSLKEVITFNEQNRDRAMPYFGQEHMLTAEERSPLSREDYRNVLQKCQRLSRTEGIDKVLQEHQLDAIVAPTADPPWVTDLVNGDPPPRAEVHCFLQWLVILVLRFLLGIFLAFPSGFLFLQAFTRNRC